MEKVWFEQTYKSTADTFVNIKLSYYLAPYYAAPQEWNVLPLSLPNIESLNTFKKDLKSHLFIDQHYKGKKR